MSYTSVKKILVDNDEQEKEEYAELVDMFAIEKWYGIHISKNDGLWLGNGISSQYKLSIDYTPKVFSAALESDSGYVIKDSNAVMVKFLQ